VKQLADALPLVDLFPRGFRFLFSSVLGFGHVGGPTEPVHRGALPAWRTAALDYEAKTDPSVFFPPGLVVG